MGLFRANKKIGSRVLLKLHESDWRTLLFALKVRFLYIFGLKHIKLKVLDCNPLEFLPLRNKKTCTVFLFNK